MSAVIGIDPGFTGAIAILRADGTLSVEDMPIVTSGRGKVEIAHPLLLELLNVPGGVLWLERVSVMPGQGITSAFRFGQGYGAIETAAAANALPVNYVTSPVWKRYFGLPKDKDAARGLAMKRFPASADLFKRKKDSGRAEAALIAVYGAAAEAIRRGAAA